MLLEILCLTKTTLQQRRNKVIVSLTGVLNNGPKEKQVTQNDPKHADGSYSVQRFDGTLWYFCGEDSAGVS